MPLPFDFYVPSWNLVIEYQGKQHYRKGINYFIKLLHNEKLGIQRFRLLKKHDRIKKKYCKENNIKLLEIKYNENIEQVLSNFFSR